MEMGKKEAFPELKNDPSISLIAWHKMEITV